MGLVNSEHLPASCVHTCTHPRCWTSRFLHYCTLFEALRTTMLPVLATTLKSRHLWCNDASKMRETMCDCSGCWFVDNPATQFMNALWRSESPGQFAPRKLDKVWQGVIIGHHEQPIVKFGPSLVAVFDHAIEHFVNAPRRSPTLITQISTAQKSMAFHAGGGYRLPFITYDQLRDKKTNNP